jgi:amino acid transporter
VSESCAANVRTRACSQNFGTSSSGAYPTGGGSYIVASANLGQRVGGFAGAALMIDYILSVAVGISAGVGAMVSAIPSPEPA